MVGLTIVEGDIIRAYDFKPMVGREDCYIEGQVMEIIGNRAVILDDASESEYPENCVEFQISDLRPL